MFISKAAKKRQERKQLTFAFGLLGRSFSSPSLLKDILETFFLVVIYHFQFGISTNNFGNVEGVRVVGCHGRTAKTSTKVFCTCAKTLRVIGCVEDAASELLEDC